MSRLEALGLVPVINAAGAYTRLGGSRLAPGVIEAMAEASERFVDYERLSRAVGDSIAVASQNDACMVTTGAAAGVAISVAACIAGADPERIARFPVNEDEAVVVMQESHRIGIEYSARMTGASLRFIGTRNEAAPLEELRRALVARTTCVVVLAGSAFEPAIPLPAVIEVAHAAGVPVIVDAADQIPPIANLHYFTAELGADLVVFSGGKGLRGPQGTGLILGSRVLVEHCRVNSSPNTSFGRPMKVGKEELLGVLAAVQWAISVDEVDNVERCELVVATWLRGLVDIGGVSASRGYPGVAGQPLPRAVIRLRSPTAATAAIEELRLGCPSIEVGAVDDRTIALNPQSVADDEIDIVLRRVRSALHGSAR